MVVNCSRDRVGWCVGSGRSEVGSEGPTSSKMSSESSKTTVRVGWVIFEVGGVAVGIGWIL